MQTSIARLQRFVGNLDSHYGNLIRRSLLLGTTASARLMSPTMDNLASGAPSYSHCWSACTSSKQGLDVCPARRQFLVEKSVADVIDTSEDEDVIPSRKPFRPTRYRQRNYLRVRSTAYPPVRIDLTLFGLICSREIGFYSTSCPKAGQDGSMEKCATSHRSFRASR